MRRLASLTGLLLTFIAFSGCMDDGPAPEGRTWEFTLEVKSGTSDTVDLYTLNDNETQMTVTAMGFQVPGQDELEVPNPMIRVQEGDTVILTVINNNQLPHTFHLHGGLVPWDMDGVPYLNQLPIHSGEEKVYVFEDLKAGTYWYHCHVDVAHHIDLGMYGAFIVEEREPEYEADDDFVLMLDEWDNCHVHQDFAPLTRPSDSGDPRSAEGCGERVIADNLGQNTAGNVVRSPLCDQDIPDALREQLECDRHSQTPQQQVPREWYPVTYPVYAPEYNSYLINGKSFPDTPPLVVEEGGTYRIRLINVGEEMHSMHLHGHSFLVTHRDGYPLPAPFRADTLGIMPGERYDLIVEADNPGFWAYHDHVGLNAMNDDHAPGGMFTVFAYDGFLGIDTSEWERAIEAFWAIEPHLGAGHM